MVELRTFLLAMAMAFLPAPAAMASPPGDEIAEHKIVIDAVKTAIERNDYDALNNMETEFRRTRARTTSGIWKLSIFHWRVKTELGPRGEDQCDDRSTGFFDRWLAKTPNEPAPYISRAAVLEAYAWCIRGGGYADSVSDEALEAFAAKVDEARRILDEHRATAAVDPHYYAVMSRILIDQGAEKTEFKQLLEEAAAVDPDYHYVYFDAYRYFQPQWYGSDAEVDAFARYSAARAKSEGLGMYARYYWYALDCDCGGIAQSIDWPKMKQAMRDVIARYPSDWNAANFARISCVMEDPQEARSWLARVKGDYTVAWTKMPELMRCLEMAQPLERSTERCPYAAREGWSRADVDEYCRFGS